ncbi:MAG: hypothetical protein Q9M91_06380 [Candidatus Dojkabacteria bacterium]|nr:hypothetical protein [Candidatus Dojkabacteria bacterium]MDQ7021422.1 hypothetical protein [Candidatus Dojkabacteria bacterium]
MNRKYLILLVLMLILIALGMFTFLETEDKENKPNNESSINNTIPTSSPTSNLENINDIVIVENFDNRKLYKSEVNSFEVRFPSPEWSLGRDIRTSDNFRTIEVITLEKNGVILSIEIKSLIEGLENGGLLENGYVDMYRHLNIDGIDLLIPNLNGDGSNSFLKPDSHKSIIVIDEAYPSNDAFAGQFTRSISAGNFTHEIKISYPQDLIFDPSINYEIDQILQTIKWAR